MLLSPPWRGINTGFRRTPFKLSPSPGLTKPPHNTTPGLRQEGGGQGGTIGYRGREVQKYRSIVCTKWAEWAKELGKKEGQRTIRAFILGARGQQEQY